MTDNYEAIIFDLDDTLFDCSGMLVQAARRRAARALVECGLPMEVDEAIELQEDLAKHHGPCFLVFDEIGRRYDLGKEALDAAYQAYNADEVMDIEPFPDAISTLRELREQGRRCLLLTSGNYHRQQAKIQKLGIGDEFDDILVNDQDRGATLDDCMEYMLERNGLDPNRCAVVGDRPDQEIRIGNRLGLTTIRMMQGRFRSAEPRVSLEKADYRVNHLFQVPTVLRLSEMGKTPESLRVVALGGGTGLPVVLEGCKAYSRKLSAIVAVTDNGRSSGRLRDELGMLAPGDARNCLVALSEPGPREHKLNELFQYRFNDGSFDGMSLGNLVIAAAAEMQGSFERGIRTVSELLNIQGKVLPATVTDCHVGARLEDGSRVRGEVDVRSLDSPPIEEVFLDPEDCEALPEVVHEIRSADVIVLGPGSLYTSVIPNLLVPDIREALADSDATVCYVCNVVTQPGQTDGYNAADHYRAIREHLGEGIVDCMLLNRTRPEEDIMERYRQDGAEFIEPGPGAEELSVDLHYTDLIEDLDAPRILWEKQDLLRHHPDKLADSVCREVAGMETRRSRQEVGEPVAG
ncbi:MAG: uridine diphosphate-N-acetylglucosamine-binding protein YvcK [Planctomycetota bacterium]